MKSVGSGQSGAALVLAVIALAAMVGVGFLANAIFPRQAEVVEDRQRLESMRAKTASEAFRIIAEADPTLDRQELILQVAQVLQIPRDAISFQEDQQAGRTVWSISLNGVKHEFVTFSNETISDVAGLRPADQLPMCAYESNVDLNPRFICAFSNPTATSHPNYQVRWKLPMAALMGRNGPNELGVLKDRGSREFNFSGGVFRFPDNTLIRLADDVVVNFQDPVIFGNGTVFERVGTGGGAIRFMDAALFQGDVDFTPYIPRSPDFINPGAFVSLVSTTYFPGISFQADVYFGGNVWFGPSAAPFPIWQNINWGAFAVSGIGQAGQLPMARPHPGSLTGSSNRTVQESEIRLGPPGQNQALTSLRRPALIEFTSGSRIFANGQPGAYGNRNTDRQRWFDACAGNGQLRFCGRWKYVFVDGSYGARNVDLVQFRGAAYTDYDVGAGVFNMPMGTRTGGGTWIYKD